MDIMYRIYYGIINEDTKILTREHVLEITEKIERRTYIFIIPHHIIEVEPGAFSDTDYISLVIIQGKMKEIPSFCFDNCHSLKAISFYTDTIKRINLNAFNNCVNLRYINLPDNLEYIGEGAFFNCHELDLKYLPVNLKDLGRNSFMQCKKITLTHLPEGIKCIKEYTFQSCENIKSFYVKPTVEIGNFSFAGCINLRSFFGNLDQLKGNNIFTENKGIDFYFPDNHSKINAIRSNYWSINKHKNLEENVREIIIDLFCIFRINNKLPNEIIINIIKQINIINFDEY